MALKKVVDNPKIKIAKNDTKKCIVSIDEIANHPHYYKSKLLLCPKCNEELQITELAGKYFLKHSRFGGYKHYSCPLYTAGYSVDTIHYIKAEFITRQEIDFNYSLIINEKETRVFVTIPTITEKTYRKFKEYKGRVVVCCENENYRIYSNDLSVNLSSYIELKNKKKVTSIRFEYENNISRHMTNWNYDDALFIFNKEGNIYYLNKITYEVNPGREYAFISKNIIDNIEGAIIKAEREVIIDNNTRYLKIIKFEENTNEVDEFLLAHDCSYSTKEKYRYHKYLDCLKSNNKTVYDFKSYEHTVIKEPKKDYYPYIGVCVSHSKYGEGYVIDIHSLEALKVRVGNDEHIIRKDMLTFHDEVYNYMRLLFINKSVIYRGKKYKFIDYNEGKILLDDSSVVDYFNKDIAIVDDDKSLPQKVYSEPVKEKEKSSSVNKNEEFEGYKIGQTIVFNNSKYKIEKIIKDKRKLLLCNVNIKVRFEIDIDYLRKKLKKHD